MITHVAIAIRRFANGQNHVGVLYLSDGNGVRLCHLAFHHDLRFEAPSNGYFWLDPVGLDETNRYVLAAFFENLSQEHPNIPYGFALDGDCFDENDHFVQPPAGKGLTCATFVVAVLEHFGLFPIDASTWPARAEDAEWQETIQNLMRENTDASEEHLTSLLNDKGAVRLKPQDVAAATLRLDWPSTFDEVAEMADQIVQELAA